MRAFANGFAILSETAPEVLPSTSARTALLSAVGRHENRLVALRRQAEGALLRGEAEADEALQAAAETLEGNLAIAGRMVAAELEEIVAACEDGLASTIAAAATSADSGAAVLEELVATTRQSLRTLPASLGEATAKSSADAVASLHQASSAAQRAVGDGASSLVCGCGVAESAIAAELARARDQLVAEVLRAARAPRKSAEYEHEKWGAMWARLDELLNASLRRCVSTARDLGEWSASALPAPCVAVEQQLREALPRMRHVWHAHAVRIGRHLHGTAGKLQQLFAECERLAQEEAADDMRAGRRSQPDASPRAAAAPPSATPEAGGGDAMATAAEERASSANSAWSASDGGRGKASTPVDPNRREGGGDGAAMPLLPSAMATLPTVAELPTAAAAGRRAGVSGCGSSVGGSPRRLSTPLPAVHVRSAQAMVAAALQATASAIVGVLCKGLERLLTEGQAAGQALSGAAATDPVCGYLASSADSAALLLKTVRDAHHWERGELYEEVERMRLGVGTSGPSAAAHAASPHSSIRSSPSTLPLHSASPSSTAQSPSVPSPSVPSPSVSSTATSGAHAGTDADAGALTPDAPTVEPRAGEASSRGSSAQAVPGTPEPPPPPLAGDAAGDISGGQAAWRVASQAGGAFAALFGGAPPSAPPSAAPALATIDRSPAASDGRASTASASDPTVDLATHLEELAQRLARAEAVAAAATCEREVVRTEAARMAAAAEEERAAADRETAQLRTRVQQQAHALGSLSARLKTAAAGVQEPPAVGTGTKMRQRVMAAMASDGAPSETMAAQGTSSADAPPARVAVTRAGPNEEANGEANGGHAVPKASAAHHRNPSGSTRGGPAVHADTGSDGDDLRLRGSREAVDDEDDEERSGVVWNAQTQSWEETSTADEDDDDEGDEAGASRSGTSRGWTPREGGHTAAATVGASSSAVAATSSARDAAAMRVAAAPAATAPGGPSVASGQDVESDEADTSSSAASMSDETDDDEALYSDEVLGLASQPAPPPSAATASRETVATGFTWRPVVPRKAAGSAEAQVRLTQQQEQRERLIARLFPGGVPNGSEPAVAASPSVSAASPSVSAASPSASASSAALPSLATPEPAVASAGRDRAGRDRAARGRAARGRTRRSKAPDPELPPLSANPDLSVSHRFEAISGDDDLSDVDDELTPPSAVAHGSSGLRSSPTASADEPPDDAQPDPAHTSSAVEDAMYFDEEEQDG